jgi:hypothetical protein
VITGVAVAIIVGLEIDDARGVATGSVGIGLTLVRGRVASGVDVAAVAKTVDGGDEG